jgi:hypothetical protein
LIIGAGIRFLPRRGTVIRHPGQDRKIVERVYHGWVVGHVTQGGIIMSKLVWTAVIALGLSATPVLAQSAGHILGGAGIGAAGGAVAGAVIPGLSVGEGAAIGAIGGAAIRATDGNGRHRHRHYRSHHGQRYWVDRHGNRHYD